MGLAQSSPDSRVNQSPAQIKPPTGVEQSANVRSVSAGQKMTLKGVVEPYLKEPASPPTP